MKIGIQLSATLLVCSFVMACSPTINYLGESYKPTQKVEVFYDKEDIQQEYKVMGVMKNEGDEFESDDLQDILEEMKKVAREKGADAILIEGAYTDKQNSEYNDKFEDGDSVTFKDSKKVLEAKLIKYKSNKQFAKDKKTKT